MVLLSLTASHHELDLDALERLSIGSSSVGRAVVHTCRPIEGAVVISTCNRFELYLDVDAPLNGDAVRHATWHVANLVATESGVSTQTAVDAFTVRTGPEVTEHLFAVASGLDSMVVGEREIAGQVKRSLVVARDQETTSKTLELLFQTASRTSKRVATRTELGSAGRSVVGIALDLAAHAGLPPWEQARVVLIGTGSYAGASVAALQARGCQNIGVYSASGRASLFAQSHDVQPVNDLGEALARADMVVSCSGARGGSRSPHGVSGSPMTAVTTDLGRSDASFVGSAVASTKVSGCPHVSPETMSLGAVALRDRSRGPEASLGHVLDTAAVARARERAAGLAGGMSEIKPLVIVDLALHRDVDPCVADMEGVLLFDLETVKTYAPVVARGVVSQAQQLVDHAVRDFEDNRLGRQADEAVVALLDEAERQVALEVGSAVAQLAGQRAAAGEPAPSSGDVDEIAYGVRRRVHSALHARIVDVRKHARAQALAQEAAVVRSAESFWDNSGRALEVDGACIVH